MSSAATRIASTLARVHRAGSAQLFRQALPASLIQEIEIELRGKIGSLVEGHHDEVDDDARKKCWGRCFFPQVLTFSALYQHMLSLRASRCLCIHNNKTITHHDRLPLVAAYLSFTPGDAVNQQLIYSHIPWVEAFATGRLSSMSSSVYS